jgi:hypothetical protein
MQFRKMWVRCANVKGELMNRGVKIPAIHTPWQLLRMLEGLIEDEEYQEKKVKAEAQWWYDWQMEKKRREGLIKAALLRAEEELAAAIDGGGQVYVFGSGPSDQFSGRTATAGDTEIQMHTRQMWRSRIKSDKREREARDRRKKTKGRVNKFTNQKPVAEVIETAAVAVANQEGDLPSPFLDVMVQENTVKLWGQRVQKVCFGASVAIAMKDDGSMIVWGGRQKWWEPLPALQIYSRWSLPSFLPFLIFPLSFFIFIFLPSLLPLPSSVSTTSWSRPLTSRGT